VKDKSGLRRSGIAKNRPISVQNGGFSDAWVYVTYLFSMVRKNETAKCFVFIEIIKGGRGVPVLGDCRFEWVEFMGIPRSVLHSFNCALFAGNYRQNEHGEMMKSNCFDSTAQKSAIGHRCLVESA